MKEDKRSYPRFIFNSPAQCAYLDSFPETFSVTVVDIGPEGIGFICDEHLRIGINIVVLINIDNGGVPLKFIAKVRWCHSEVNTGQFKVGAKIVDASERDLEKFIQFYCKCLIPRDERKKKILLVSNDKKTSKILEDEMARCNCDFFCEQSGESGFSRYLSERPDLIILDGDLPKHAADEVCRKIRKLQNDSAILIVLLAKKHKDIGKRADQLGVQKYFIKPLVIDQFLDGIDEILTLTKG